MNSNPLEVALVAGELAARQVWFRLPENHREALRTRVQRPSSGEARPRIRIDRLHEHLSKHVPSSARLLMVHSSINSFDLMSDEDTVLPGPRAALDLLGALKKLVGPQTTLCMPTHPLYKKDPGFMYEKSDLVLRYSSARTPSSVGLLTEFFRREPGAQRSAHPLSSLAALGPAADLLLADNLNEREPLPHGVDSAYFRFCQQGGLVLGIGVDLLKYLTILHVPEEVADASWPVKNFFCKRRFLVDSEAGEPREIVVRERRPEFVRSLSHRRLRRELLEERILRETMVQGVRVDTVDASPFLDFVTSRQEEGPYPYYLPALARFGRPRRAPAAP